MKNNSSISHKSMKKHLKEPLFLTFSMNYRQKTLYS